MSQLIFPRVRSWNFSLSTRVTGWTTLIALFYTMHSESQKGILRRAGSLAPKTSCANFAGREAPAGRRLRVGPGPDDQPDRGTARSEFRLRPRSRHAPSLR